MVGFLGKGRMGLDAYRWAVTARGDSAWGWGWGILEGKRQWRATGMKTMCHWQRGQDGILGKSEEFVTVGGRGLLYCFDRRDELREVTWRLETESQLVAALT